MAIGRGDIARGSVGSGLPTFPLMEEAELPKHFGEVVRELRKAQGMSQEGFAAKVGIDRAYMGGLERGVRNPSLTTMARVAKGLKMTVSDVLRRVEKKARE